MWKFRVSASYGGFSLRSLFTCILAALIVVLLGSTAVPQDASAASDATWAGAAIDYQGNRYTGPASPDTIGDLGLPENTTAYLYVEPASTTPGATRKAHVLYLAPGVDPGTANGLNYRVYDYGGPTTFTNGNTAVAISIDPQTANIGTNSCEVTGGLGWIICSFTNTFAGWMDFIFDVLSGFLDVKPLSTDQENAIYRAWSYMRSIANIAFVIAFLIIIYSQLTSVGITNYSMKKLLPRVIIAALLVNLSYIICAIAIDISNFLGFSLQNMFINMRNALVGTEGNSWDLLSWESVAGFVLSGGTAVAAGGTALFLTVASTGVGAVVLLLPALVTGLVAILVALVVIASRHALITILTVIAPLAFVAYLLPNTEQWFDKWRKLFMTMLILFPAFSVVFGGSQLAGALIIQNAESINTVILGMLVQLAPLFITPLLIKLSGALLTRIAGLVNNPNKGLIDRTRNFAKDRAEDMKAKRLGTEARPHQFMKRAGHAIERRRLTREGRRSAYKSLTEGQFSQTRQGQEIAHLNHQAHFEKADGEARANQHWEQHVQSDPRMRARRIDQIRRQGEADLNKAEVEGAGKASLDHAILNDAHLSNLRIAQARSEHQSKIYSENIAAQAEQAVRAQVEATPYLRNLEKDTINRQGQAAILKNQVEAEGKLAFREAVLADRALRLAEVNTYELQQRADLSEGIVKARSEANWQRIRTADDSVRNQEIERLRTSNAAKLAEEQWNSLVQEIQAKGHAASGIGPADRSLADAIQRVQIDIEAESKRQDSFKLEQQQSLAKHFKENEVIRLYAGGDDAEGAARVYATAKKELNDGIMSTIKNNRAVFSNYNLSELQRLSESGEKYVIDAAGNKNWVEATETERLAAYQEILLTKGNNWAAQQLKDVIAQEGMHYDEATGKYYNDKDVAGNLSNEITAEEVEKRRDRQQIFIDAYKQSKLNIASVSGQDQSDMESGQFVQSTRSAIVRDIRGKKLKTSRWASSDLDELQRMIQVFRREDTRAGLAGDSEGRESLEMMVDTINEALSDPRISQDLDGRNQELMRVIERYAQRTLDGDILTKADKDDIEQGPVLVGGKHYVPKIVAPTKYIPDQQMRPDISGPSASGNDNDNETP